MKINTSSTIITITLIIIGLFLAILLKLPLWIVWVFLLSLVIIFLTKKRAPAATLVVWVIIIVVNLGLLVFAQIPIYSQKIDLKPFFQQQKNYLTFSINDSTQHLKQQKATIIIKHLNPPTTITIPLRDENLTSQKYEVFSQDRILFVSKSKNIKSWANIYLWDGTIIRILPQTSLYLSEIFKNLDNPLLSKTHLQLQRGNIWFSNVRTILKDDSFNINTQDGTVIIRWTAGLISKIASGTIVFPHDHFLEIKTKKFQKVVAPRQIVEFTQSTLNQLDLDQLKQLLWQQISDFIKLMPQLDKQFVQDYYQSLQNFIKQNFDTAWSQTQQLKRLSVWKMKALSLINPTYKQNLEQFETYQLLTQGGDIKLNLEQINAYLVTIPLNPSIEKLKLDYLKSQAQKNIEYLKTYIINQANKLATHDKMNQALRLLQSQFSIFSPQ